MDTSPIIAEASSSTLSSSSTSFYPKNASIIPDASDSLTETTLPSDTPTQESDVPSSPFLLDYEPNDALFFATMTGDVDAAKQALELGASPNYRNSHQLTPLHICCGGVGPLPMIDLLIKAGADINAIDSTGWTPLILVSSSGQLPLLNRLLSESTINLHQSMENQEINWYPLTRAAFRGQAKTVERLLEVGTNFSQSITQGKNAEESAQVHNHTEVMDVIKKYREKQQLQ